MACFCVDGVVVVLVVLVVLAFFLMGSPVVDDIAMAVVVVVVVVWNGLIFGTRELAVKARRHETASRRRMFGVQTLIPIHQQQHPTME